MSISIRRAIGAAAILAMTLSGCSTGMGKDQCVAADWTMVGFEDGLHGWPSDRIGVHRVACAKHQVTPDLKAYLAGREKGLAEFCQPKNGFRVGLHGGGYANVCSGPAEPAFVDSYRAGRQIHEARSELRSAQARLRSSRDGLAHTEAAMTAVTAELVLPGVSTERRSFLAAELVRLTQERTELIARVDYLMQRTQQLAFSVQALERQSPYPI